MIQFHENVCQGARDLLQIILQNQKFRHYVNKATLTSLGVRGEMKADIKNKEDVKLWIETLEQTTNTTYRVNYTKPSVGVWILYKLGVKCHHNTGGKKLNSDLNKSCKNTKCPTRITFTVNAIPKKAFKRNNNVDPDLPTVIDFYYEHNHPINSAEVLRFRPVDASVEEKILNLYQKGHSPSSALQILKMDLENEHPNDFESIVTDRKFCPDLSYCHRLFYKKFKNKYDSFTATELHAFLLAKINEYNSFCNMVCAKMAEPPEEFILAICTPLMHRIHQHVPQTRDVMIVDTIGSIKDKDKEKTNKTKSKDNKDGGYRMFLLSTYNSTGSLPLGIIITMSDSLNAIYNGLELYKSLLPQDGNYFYGRGGIGPAVILTDESSPERIAFHMAWHYSTILLCSFRLLQSFWKWLMRSHNGIKKEDRVVFFQMFKSVTYAETEVKCQENFSKLKFMAKDCALFLNHINSLWERRNEWALCYRSGSLLFIRENNSNNTSNGYVKIAKDEIFERVRTFNLAQIIDFIFSRFETYYNRRLLDVAYDRTTQTVQKKIEFRNPYWKNPPETILKSIREENGMYCVPSESDPENSHSVDVDLVCCTCSIGRNGVFCKHQYWVSLVINKTSQQKSIQFRKHCFYLAKGVEANDMWLLHNNLPAAASLSKIKSTEEHVINKEDFLTETPENGLEHIWKDGLNVLRDKIASPNDETLILAIKQFVENLKSISQTSSIISSLKSFGDTCKDPETDIPKKRNTIKIATRKKSLITTLKRKHSENCFSNKRQVIEKTEETVKEKVQLEENNPFNEQLNISINNNTEIDLQNSYPHLVETEMCHNVLDSSEMKEKFYSQVEPESDKKTYHNLVSQEIQQDAEDKPYNSFIPEENIQKSFFQNINTELNTNHYLNLGNLDNKGNSITLNPLSECSSKGNYFLEPKTSSDQMYKISS